MDMGNSVFTPSAIFRISVPAKPCCLLRPHFNWSPKKKNGGSPLRRRWESCSTNPPFLSPYLYALSIPPLSGYLTIHSAVFAAYLVWTLYVFTAFEWERYRKFVSSEAWTLGGD